MVTARKPKPAAKAEPPAVAERPATDPAQWPEVATTDTATQEWPDLIAWNDAEVIVSPVEVEE